MLFVDDGETQALIGDVLLEDGVRSDEDIDRAVSQAHQRRLAGASLLPPGEDRDIERETGKLAGQSLVMLAREDFGGREQCALRAPFDRDQKRLQGHQGLPRTDIALKQDRKSVVYERVCQYG